MDVIILGNSPSLTQTFYDDSGLVDVDAEEDVTVTIYDTGGYTVDTGTATAVTTGTYGYTSFVPTALDFCTVKWSGPFDSMTKTEWSEVEVVGRRYFALPKMRDQAVFEDTNRYPDSALAAARTAAENRAEEIIGISYVPRAKKLQYRSNTYGYLKLPPFLRSIRSVKSGTSDVTYCLKGSVLVPYLTDLPCDTDIDVVIEYGKNFPDESVSNAVMMLATAYAQMPKSAIPSRAERWQPDGSSGMFQLAMAGPDRTGIPEVDAVFLSKRLPGMA